MSCKFLSVHDKSGKTTTVEQLIEQWPYPTRYATADQVAPPSADFLEAEWVQARRLAGEKPLLIIDEVQKIPRWSEVVKNFMMRTTTNGGCCV